MSDDPAVTPPATDPPATPPVPPAKPSLADTPPEQLDAEKLRDLVLTQRANEAALQAQLAEAKKATDELAAIKAAQLSDEEKRQAEHDQALKDAATGREALRRGLLLAELSKAEHGIVDAEAAAALIQGVEYGDDGRPTNTTEQIAALLETRPFLKAPAGTAPRAPDINGGAGTGGAAPPKLTAEEVAFAQRLGKTPEEYAAWKNVSTATDAAQAAALNKT